MHNALVMTVEKIEIIRPRLAPVLGNESNRLQAAGQFTVPARERCGGPDPTTVGEFDDAVADLETRPVQR